MEKVKIKILSSGAELIEKAFVKSNFDYSIEMIYPPRNIFNRALRFIFARIKCIGRETFLKKVLGLNRDVEYIVIFDSIFWDNNIDLIREMFPRSKLIYFFLNIVEKKHDIESVKKFSNRVFTFDREDSIRYELNYHHFFSSITRDQNPVSKNIDVIFVGKNKKRQANLEECYTRFKDLGLATCFYVVKDSIDEYSDVFEMHSNNISIEKYNEYLLKSKCILEICQEGQTDCTIRAIEAVAGHQKIITNNSHIRSYDFYSSNNILVLDANTTDKELKKFVSSKYSPLDESIYNKYMFENWLLEIVKV